MHSNPSSLLGSNTTTPNRDLKSVIEELPERKAHVLEQVGSLIQKMLTKNLAGLPFVQELIWEYFCCAGPVNIRKMIPNLLDYLLLLTGTRPGCKVGRQVDRIQIYDRRKDVTITERSHRSSLSLSSDSPYLPTIYLYIPLYIHRCYQNAPRMGQPKIVRKWSRHWKAMLCLPYYTRMLIYWSSV